VRATHIHFDSDNDKLFVDIIAAPIFDKNGEVIQVIESIRDITQIKKAEEAIKEHAKDLEESNRLKDLFIDIMRHDILGPIGTIKNSSDLLLEEGSAEEKEKLVSIINSSAASLIEVIEAASKYAALNELKDIELQIFDANKLLKESMEAYGPLAKEKNITIEHKISRSCMFKASPLIKDVISNLVSNAIKHSPKNSKVILEVEIGPPCRITVKDNGPGILDKEKERIFERFSRIKKEGVKGSGLGLAIVKRVVDLHKGRVWVEDNPEGGSVFCVVLPKESLKDK
jgi:signal transduction histidine kinase